MVGFGYSSDPKCRTKGIRLFALARLKDANLRCESFGTLISHWKWNVIKQFERNDGYQRHLKLYTSLSTVSCHIMAIAHSASKKQWTISNQTLKLFQINFYGVIPSQLEPKLRLAVRATTYAAWVMLAENASIFRVLSGDHRESNFSLA